MLQSPSRKAWPHSAVILAGHCSVIGRDFVGKALMVSIDKATALKMHDKVRRHWAAERDGGVYADAGYAGVALTSNFPTALASFTSSFTA